jgi:hypothetical protein
LRFTTDEICSPKFHGNPVAQTKPRPWMHLSIKRLTAQGLASKMFFVSRQWRKILKELPHPFVAHLVRRSYL